MAERFGLDPVAAVTASKRVAEQLVEQQRIAEEQRRPTPLPPFASAGIVRLSRDNYPPILVADLWVEDREGRPIPGLQEKDFRVTVNEHPARKAALAPVTEERPPLQVVLAIDTSLSMQGAPLDVAKKGARAFLAGLTEPNVEVKVLSFSHAVGQCCDGSSDTRRAAASIQPLLAVGNTALYMAVNVGVRELAPRQGERRLVIFTDGKDNLGGGDAAQLIDAARKADVQIHTIGLRTRDLDATVLRQLAEATGGQYFEAKTLDDLNARFQHASRKIRRSFYRLVIQPEVVLSPTSAEIPLTIHVGGENSLTVAGE